MQPGCLLEGHSWRPFSAPEPHSPLCRVGPVEDTRSPCIPEGLAWKGLFCSSFSMGAFYTCSGATGKNDKCILIVRRPSRSYFPPSSKIPSVFIWDGPADTAQSQGVDSRGIPGDEQVTKETGIPGWVTMRDKELGGGAGLGEALKV